MQQRRYRPGDVLDDYCPRERRITDHAIVAMIDDRIKQTRCVVCDAEHEYKDGKVPPQRRKKSQSALYSQVLDGLNGPHRPARVPAQATGDEAELLLDTPELVDSVEADEPAPLSVATSGDAVAESTPLDIVAPPPANEDPEPPRREEGPWRRQLIRAALPRPEGQQPPQTRPVPEFTIRQPTNARGPRHGRRRGASGGGALGQGGNGNHGGARFGRSNSQGQGHGGRRRRGRGGKKNN